MVVLVGSGANCGFLVAQGEWFRLLTYQFLHLGWIHLAMNLLALRYFGPSIETMTGAKIFVGSYLFCGVCGGLATVSSHAGISVGASASISGLLGMALIFEIFGKERKNFQGGKGYLPTLVFIIMINLAVGLVEKGIDNSAHVGGFAGGLLMGVLALFLLSRPILRILGELAAVFFVCGIFVFSSYQFRQSRDAGGYPGRFARMRDPAPASWPIYLRIPDGWEIVKPSEHVPTHALQGPLNERVDVVLATNHDPETEVLDEYLEERTKAMSETAELEFQTRLGPKIRQIGTKKFQEVKWRLAIDSHGLTERDFLLFEPGRLLLIQCILPTHDDEVYDKTILGMLETLRLK